MKNNKYTWQYLSKGSFKTSIDSNVNFVFNEKNIYISDNHLCALWGWIKCCRPGEKYNFIHIDFHNDLKCPDVIYMPDLYKVWRIKKFNDFLRRRFVCENGLLKRFVAWDSYIQIAYFLYPEWFTDILFITSECPKKGNVTYCRNLYHAIDCADQVTDIRKNDITYRCQCNLEDVLKDIAENTSNRPTILNLDVDYFFDFDKHVRDSYWTDDKIAQVAELLKNALDRGNVKVLTIAMSPECCKGESYCDGWKNSLDVTRIFSSILSDKAKNEFLDVLDKKTKNL